MAKEIVLTRGMVAVVDDRDFDALSAFKWQAEQGFSTWYAARRNCGDPSFPTRISMHRLILMPAAGLEVDHINRNGLDNRRCNLRLATRSQNLANRPPSRRNTSGFKGVSFDASKKRWLAIIKLDGRVRRLGRFHSAAEAAEVYDRAARQLFGEYAYLNRAEAA